MPSPDKCPILLCSCHFNYDYFFEGTKTRNIVFILTKHVEKIDIQKERIVVYTVDETKIINRLFQLIRENDVITGYNTNNFDIPYVIDRARVLRIKNLNVGLADKGIYHKKHLSKGFTVTKIGNGTGKILFDVLALLRREDESNVFKKKFNLKKLTLEHISKEILGYEKLEFPVEDMIKYWENTDDVQLRDKFISYCSRDSELALMLLTKFRLLDKFITLSRASGKLVQEVINSMGSGGFVENLLLKEFRKYDRVMPIRMGRGIHKSEEELEGAEVFVPILGVSEDICSVDYKCCVGDTLVLTDSGFIKMEDIELRKANALSLNIRAQTLNDRNFQNKEIIDYKKIGKDKTKKVTLDYGYELEGGINHRIVVATDNGWSFKELKDLRPADIVVLNKGSNIYGKDVIFDYYSNEIVEYVRNPGACGRESYVDVKKLYERLHNGLYVPEKVTVEFAEFFGYMVSDGWIGTENTNLGFTQKDDKVFMKFVNLYDSVFKRKNDGQLLLSDWWSNETRRQEKETEKYDNTNIVDVINKLKKKCSENYAFSYRYKGGHEVRLSSVNLKRLFKYYGFSGNAYVKEVPWCILQSSKEVQCAFLRTLFEGDGCSCDSETNKTRRIFYLSKSKKLCAQIQLMLLNMGIISNFYHVESTNDYRLEINGYNCVLFYKNIGFVSNKKNDRTKNIVSEVMGLNYTGEECNIDYEKIEKKGKTGNQLYVELGLNEVLKNLHKKYMNSYNHLSHRSDPSFFRRIYAYTNNNDNINILMLKRYLNMIEKVMRDDESYILQSNDKDYLLLKWYAECNMVFLKVKKVEDGENELYDISIKELQNYVSNGFISHNSLYPSLMIKHNLCYSTLVLESDISKLGLTENDVEIQYDEFGGKYATFVKKEKFKGIVPRKLEELLANRAAQKKEMKKYEKGSTEYMLWDATQNATKILLNSHYGYSGDPEAKVYSWFIATAVTTNGRLQIKKTWHMIMEEIKTVKISEREFRLGVVQGDTDSSYMQVISLDKEPISRDEAIKAVNTVLDKVNATLEKPMQLDFENYVKKIIITAKKRYAMLTVDDSGKEVITSKGIETVRREWSNFSSDNMSKVIDFILKEKKTDEAVKKSVELIKEQVKLLNKGKININDLVMSKKLTKPITYYDDKQVHVQVAIKMKARGHPSEVGDRIQYIIIDNGKKLVSERGEEADYVIRNLDKFKVDKNYYIHYQLLPPALRVLELLGVKEEALTTSLIEGQKNLFEFMG